MPSVGTVKIPIVSTFDNAGIVAAKAGMRDLSQTKVGSQGGGSSGSSAGGSGGGGSGGQSSYAKEADQIFERTRTSNEKYEYQVRKLDDLHKRGAISTNTYNRAIKQAGDTLPKTHGLMGGVGQAGSALANATGFGGVTGAIESMGAVGAVAGVAAVGVAMYAMTQAAAGNAQAVKQSAMTLGVSTRYYGGLEKAARNAGISMGEATEGVGKFIGKLHGAALGADMGSAVYLRSLGISAGDLQNSIENPEALTSRVGSMRNGDKAALFGSVRAANAAASAGGDNGRSIFDKDAAMIEINSRMQTGLGNVGSNLLGGLGFMIASTWNGGPKKYAEQLDKDVQDDRQGKHEAAMQDSGSKLVGGLASAADVQRYANEARRNFIYSRDPGEQAKYQKLSAAQTGEARLEAEKPNVSSREYFERKMRIAKYRAQPGEKSHVDENGNVVRDPIGYSNTEQAKRARINIMEEDNSAHRNVSSNAENIKKDVDIARNKWSVAEKPKATEADTALLTAQQQLKQVMDVGAAIKRGEDIGVPDAAKKQAKAQEMAEKQVADAQKKVDSQKPQTSLEQRDVARGIGDSLTDYAESITRSGSLAGAYDVNSVAGYSQQVGSEYQMDQSKDTLNLIAKLLQKLVDKTPEGQSLFTSVMDNLGFRTADPILGGR